MMQINPKYTFDDLLSLKMYTDETEFTSRFRQSFWTFTPLSHKAEFYIWAMSIYKASLYHAKPLPVFDSKKASPIKLYHGIDAIFAVNDRCPKYFGPVSTTKEDNVANNLAKGSGFLWLIDSNYFNRFRLILG